MAYEDENNQPIRERVTTEREVTAEGQDREAMHQERPVTPLADHKMNVASRIIWLVLGIIMGLLALRFLLRLLAANPNNGFADFIYSLSHPFAAPFWVV